MHAIHSHYRVIGNIVITDISVLVCGHRGPCSKYDISIAEGDFKGELGDGMGVSSIEGTYYVQIVFAIALEVFTLS